MKVGDIIDGRYTAVRKLGNGSMGEVWVVQDQKTGTTCALKYCLSSDEGDLNRFDREVRIMAGIRHAHVINVIEYNMNCVPPYFTMPLAEGNLWVLLRQYKGDVKQVLHLFDAVCAGVAALHAGGAYHRDINPNNVLFFADKRIAVSDLGLGRNILRGSKIHDSSRTAYGSAFYTSPEQDDALENADARSEVFQLGKTLYALLTDAHPRVMDPSKVTPGLYYIIEKATKPNPDERYQTVQELQAAVAGYIPALDKTIAPLDSFKHEVIVINQRLRSGGDIQICLPVLDQLNLVKDDAIDFFHYFENLPNYLLGRIVKDLPNEVLPFFRLYDSGLSGYINEEKYGDFEYAEVIADQMAVIFRNSSSLEVKRMALGIAMEQAISFNRYNAMDTFDNLLEGISNDEEALAIADLLREKADWYIRVYHHLPKRKLHLHLQKVYQEMEERSTRDQHDDSGDVVAQNPFDSW
jgi:eukaryotic-like serine/threonine-protein kinase